MTRIALTPRALGFSRRGRGIVLVLAAAMSSGSSTIGLLPSERFADWRGRAVPTVGEPPLSEDEAIPRSVLIVDDSAPFQASARALLEARGYAIAGTAADGAGALEAVRALRPDAVLLDVNLPDMNGVDVAERLACDDTTLAVVLVSTLEVSALGRSVDACGARGFVAKSELASPRLVDLLGPPDG